MAYGFQVFNTSASTVQIDSNYKNLFYNRTIYYSSESDLYNYIFPSLSIGEFPVFPLATVTNSAGSISSSGYITVFKTYDIAPPTGYGFTVFKEDGSVVYSSSGRAVDIISNSEIVPNRFIDMTLTKNIYLPAPRNGKVRNILFNFRDYTFYPYNYNVFKRKYHPYDHQGLFIVNSSITNGIQHLIMTYEIPDVFDLVVLIIDS